jgi:AraC-like DNA-binding protein
VTDFAEGDLMLIAPKIPHFFRNNAEYYKKNGKLEASSIFIHFTNDCLGKNFFDLPEMKLVQKLLENARYALEIHGSIKPYVIEKLQHMCTESAAHRLVSLLDILVKISESQEVIPVLSAPFKEKEHPAVDSCKDTDRMSIILEYITNNFHREIYVNEIAAKLHMCNASFSRYFKHHTRKTFSDYITELRISHACNLLMMDDQSIAQISFDSGFENLSNFYKHFRRITGIIPKEYRKRFLQASD